MRKIRPAGQDEIVSGKSDYADSDPDSTSGDSDTGSCGCIAVGNNYAATKTGLLTILQLFY